MRSAAPVEFVRSLLCSGAIALPFKVRDRQLVWRVIRDVKKALFLANRVIVLSDRPAYIKAEIAVQRPCPRRRGDRYLADQCRQTLGLSGLDATS